MTLVPSPTPGSRKYLSRGGRRLALCSTLLLVLSAELRATETVEEILAGHIEALGGKAAISAVRSLHLSGDLTVENQFTGILTGSIETVIVPRQQIFLATELGAFSTTSGWDGRTAWEQGAQGLRQLTGAELSRLQQQSQLFFTTGLWRSADTEIKRLKDLILEDREHYVIEFSGPEPVTVYLAKDSMLVSQTTQAIELPGIGKTWAVTDFWDYQEAAGVMVPRTVSVAIEGVFSSESVFTQTTVNGPVDPQQFAMPESVR